MTLDLTHVTHISIWYDIKKLKTITFCPKKRHLIQASADLQNFFHFILSEIKKKKRTSMCLSGEEHWYCLVDDIQELLDTESVQFGMGTFDYLNIYYLNFIFNCNLMLNRCSVEPKVKINTYWCMPSFKTIWTTSLIIMSESCY